MLFLSFAISISAQTKEAQKIEQFRIVQCDDYLARMDNFSVQAQNDPSAFFYVFIYEGKESKYNSQKKREEIVAPTFGSAKAKIVSMKKYLTVMRGVSKDRIQFIEGGFRETSEAEIWLVPPGATPPKPTPTLTKMKFRKGKPIGFCLYCCG